MAIPRRQLSRRQVLALGTTGVGLAFLAAAASGAGAIARGAAAGMRPGARAGGGVACALCGETGHTMLDGRHGPLGVPGRHGRAFGRRR